jgi:hypothetical protein
MQAVTTASQPDWPLDPIPPTSFRDGAASDDVHRIGAEEKPAKRTGPTIREIRQSMATTQRPSRTSSAMKPQPVAPKKKPSIFGGIFATKEPTQLALNQVAARMIAQHGSTSAVNVPHVRMEKMPEFVPKVNSKWDGVPDNIKEREKREKDRQRALKRQSILSSHSARPRSVESSDRRGRGGHSTTSSSAGRSTSSRGVSRHSHYTDARSPNPHKFYAQSVNSSGDLASQQRADDTPGSSTTYSGSLRSRSELNLPDITTSVPEEVPAPPTVPAMHRPKISAYTRQNDLNGTSRASKASQPSVASRDTAPSFDTMPDHTSSAAATPREGSPVTPSILQGHEPFSSVRASIVSSQGSVSLESSGPNVLPLPVSTKGAGWKRPGEAFLAGEAQPLELPDENEDPAPTNRDLPLRQWGNLRSSFLGQKPLDLPSRSMDWVAQDLSKRPDSSRSRLGMKPTMLLRTDAAPWEGQQTTSALHPRSANARSRLEPVSPKRLTVGSFKKKGG